MSGNYANRGESVMDYLARTVILGLAWTVGLIIGFLLFPFLLPLFCLGRVLQQMGVPDLVDWWDE